MGCGSHKGGDKGEELFAAAKTGDTVGIESAFKARADINWSKPGEEYTPLMIACWNRHNEAALLLIRKGAQINIANTEYGSTALHVASFHGLEDVVNSLLACEADFEIQNKAGKTALDDARTRGHKKIVQILQEKRNSMLGFDEAAGRQLLQVVQNPNRTDDQLVADAQKALTAGADPDFCEDNSKYTPLMHALWNRREQLACFLMDNKAEINIHNTKFGSTPLHIACRHGLKIAVQKLIDKGADKKATDGQGKMPIEDARASGNNDVIETLNPRGRSSTNSKKGVDVQLPDHWTTDIDDFPLQGWKAIMLDEGAPIFNTLQTLLKTDGSQLGKGRDVLEKGNYNSLVLKCAWRIENLNLWKMYCAQRDAVQQEIDNIQASGFSCAKPNLRKEFTNALMSLPLDLQGDLNEVCLLHGLRPDTALTILHNGCNMRFSNGSFGAGTYLAEDSGKSDQYCIKDTGADPALEELYTRLYRRGDTHVDHPGDVYYVLVVRNLAGYCVRSKSGDAAARDIDWDQPVYATAEKRELALIPNIVPPTHYHSLVVELGAAIKRYREFVQFHEGRLYPEYLLAYHRVSR